ncbi:hypothetical protein B296_00029884 [Ensete ventricosum]|uniref:Uncharacterized protein n=1 Tax=Ensete ventricosum TaxID=4639 RepID=A0A426XUP3_ENSVE|nr:hypothetical protein B296_00029884 [Ensete ventricosum]
MRIRKCAARLLGTLPVCSSPTLPAGLALSPTPLPHPRSWESETSSAAATSSSAGLLCELNRSPWDDLLCLDLMASCDQYCQEEEEEEDGGGSLGNGVKDEVEESKGIMVNRIKHEAAAVASLPDR